jgi:hypothetical protein
MLEIIINRIIKVQLKMTKIISKHIVLEQITQLIEEISLIIVDHKDLY